MHADEWSRDWTVLDAYRGVNANMHSVEALLAAHDATGDPEWLARAASVADRVVGWARENDWRIPEHFDADWNPCRTTTRTGPGTRSSRTGRRRATAWSGRACCSRSTSRPARPARAPTPQLPCSTGPSRTAGTASTAAASCTRSTGRARRSSPGATTGSPRRPSRPPTCWAASRATPVRRGRRGLVGVDRRAPRRPRARVVAPRARHRQPARRRHVGRQARRLPRGPGRDPARPAAHRLPRRLGQGRRQHPGLTPGPPTAEPGVARHVTVAVARDLPARRRHPIELSFLGGVRSEGLRSGILGHSTARSLRACSTGPGSVPRPARRGLPGRCRRRPAPVPGGRPTTCLPPGHDERARTGPVRALSKAERVTGIEPALSAWEAEVLPLNYTRAAPVAFAPGPLGGSSANQRATRS